VVGRLRAGEDEALGRTAVQLGQRPALLLGLDPLGDDTQAEGPGELDDRGDQSGRGAARGQVARATLGRMTSGGALSVICASTR
jgi:hypothetical protein